MEAFHYRRSLGFREVLGDRMATNGSFLKTLLRMRTDKIFIPTLFTGVAVAFELPFPNQKIEASVTSLLNDIQRANDLVTLDLHHGRAGAYLSALLDLEVLPREEMDSLFLLLDRLYQAEFSRLGLLGTL